MKKLLALVLITIGLITLTGCSGSDKIIGTWNAQDSEGNITVIEITENTIIMNGVEDEYTQNAIGTKNGVEYYGLRVNGSTDLSIIFPDDSDELALVLFPYSTDNYLVGDYALALHKTESPDYYQYQESYLS